MARFLIMLDYTDASEWSVGAVPGFGKGEEATGPEMAQVLRQAADQIDKWAADGNEMKLPVKYPEHRGPGNNPEN